MSAFATRQRDVVVPFPFSRTSRRVYPGGPPHGGDKPRRSYGRAAKRTPAEPSMLDRLLSVFVAVGLALLLWLYARSREQEILDNVQIPVQITLNGSQAEQYSLETHADCRIMVSFSGSPARIRELRGILQRGELT